MAIDSTKLKCAAAAVSVAVSCALYAAAFEPYGVAEFAYVFAIPAVVACKLLFVETRKQPDPARRPRPDFAKTPLPAATLKTHSANTESVSASATPCATTFQHAPAHSAQPRKKSPIKRVYLISAFVGTYAAWVWILAWLRHVYPPAGYAAVAVLPLIISAGFIFPWFALLPKMLPRSDEDALSRLVNYLAIASVWTLLEWLRSWIMTGFPWLVLANSQWTRTAVIQSASWGGVWFVSFSLIFFNLATAEYVCRLYKLQRAKFAAQNAAKQNRFTPEFYVALLLILSGVWTYIANLPRAENERTEFRAGLVQTDFAGILKWNDALATQNLQTISALTQELSKNDTDVILWPEAATPPRYPVNFPQMKAWIEDAARRANTPLLIGALTYDTQTDTAQNGAFFVSEKSGFAPHGYAKKHLVPFGEYVPAPFSFLGKVVPVGNMKRGDTDTPFPAEINGKTYKIGTMICYEDVFPELGRSMAKNGADMLFVCTNDSWYGREAGAWQHASHSALQAAATRKVLLRSSNNGLSTVFDQYGRMLPCTTISTADGKTWNAANGRPERAMVIKNEFGKTLDSRTLAPRRPAPMLDSDNSIYFRGCGFVDVITYKNFDSAPSFYVRYGNWFVWVCAAFTLAGVAKILLSSRKKQRIKKA